MLKICLKVTTKVSNQLIDYTRTQTIFISTGIQEKELYKFVCIYVTGHKSENFTFKKINSGKNSYQIVLLITILCDFCLI